MPCCLASPGCGVGSALATTPGCIIISTGNSCSCCACQPGAVGSSITGSGSTSAIASGPIGQVSCLGSRPLEQGVCVLSSTGPDSSPFCSALLLFWLRRKLLAGSSYAASSLSQGGWISLMPPQLNFKRLYRWFYRCLGLRLPRPAGLFLSLLCRSSLCPTGNVPVKELLPL